MSRIPKEQIFVKEAISEYESIRPGYKAFEVKMKALVAELIENKKIKIHTLESRTKSIGSFHEKITRPGKRYNDPINELSDLIGLRVITYYMDDVPLICDLFKEEFHVYSEECIDKQVGYNANEFGYISVHLVISLKEPRSKLPEWTLFAGKKVEVQVRTVLQHSWAAISHALQYKHENDVPDALKRRLFRLAGLFELVDEEFIAIRDRHLEIQKKVSLDFDNDDQIILIDAITIIEFIKRSEYLELVTEFAIHNGYQLDQSDEDFISIIAKECERLGINTIEDLERAITKDVDVYKRFLQVAKGKSTSPWYVSKSFLLYMLIINAYLNHFSQKYLVTEYEWGPDIAQRVLDAAAESKKIAKTKNRAGRTRPRKPN